MSTEAFNTVNEYAMIRSERSNTRMGFSAFEDVKAKLSASKTESETIQVRVLKIAQKIVKKL